MDVSIDALTPQPPIIRKPAKKPPWKGLLVGVFSGGLGALLAAGAIRVLGEDMTGVAGRDELRATFGAGAGVVLVGIAIAAMWLAILAHEVGHLIGGALARFRFHLLVVGPLRVERDDDRIRVRLNRDLSLYGGIAGSLPTGMHALPRRLGLMVAGGPAVSFLLAGATAALIGGPLAGAPVPLMSLLGMMMIVSSGLGVVTLIPMRFSGFASDGARLLRRLCGGPQAGREAAMLSLIGISVAGTAPRDWPAETVRAASELRDGSSDEVTGQLLAYSHLLDRGDTAGARLALHRALELADRYPQPFVPGLMAEAAFFEGFVTRDAAAARAYLAEVPEKSPAVKPYDRLRAEAALALAEGDQAGAAERIRRALATTPADDAFRRALLDQMAAAAGSSVIAEPIGLTRSQRR
ncbi:MAG TPA: M50 family metallopeptidase [Longimicrobium sp.]|nr:M50 family metallopeptidase [Longimicrobium sp.]